jgi:hypothetical protein
VVNLVVIRAANLLRSPQVTRPVNLPVNHPGNLVVHQAQFRRGYLLSALLLRPPVRHQDNQLQFQLLQVVSHLANHRLGPLASLPVPPAANLAVIPPLLPRLRPPSRQVFPP